MIAAKELGVLNPLKDCGLTKLEIRAISREVYRLLPPTSRRCLSFFSVSYGSRITARSSLRWSGGDFLFERGMRVLRARHHGDLLRLELGIRRRNFSLPRTQARGHRLRQGSGVCLRDRGHRGLSIRQYDELKKEVLGLRC